MTDNKLILLKIKESTGLRLALLFGSFFMLLLISSFLSQAISQISGISERSGLLINSTFQCFLAFIIPALITAKFASNSPWRWLDLSGKVTWKPFAGVIIVYLLFIPAMNKLVEWNANIHFPVFLQGLENMFRTWEENGKATTDIILENHGVFQMILSVVVVGLLTGFSEEIFFRGAMQKIFIQSSVGKTTAIWITAIIFSTFHFQFFGFIPRMLMGAFFGYLVVRTGSLWVPIFAHALNNSMVVIFSGIYGVSGENNFIEKIGLNETGFPVTAFISAALTLLFIYYFKGFFFSRK